MKVKKLTKLLEELNPEDSIDFIDEDTDDWYEFRYVGEKDNKPVIALGFSHDRPSEEDEE